MGSHRDRLASGIPDFPTALWSQSLGTTEPGQAGHWITFSHFSKSSVWLCHPHAHVVRWPQSSEDLKGLCSEIRRGWEQSCFHLLKPHRKKNHTSYGRYFYCLGKTTNYPNSFIFTCIHFPPVRIGRHVPCLHQRQFQADFLSEILKTWYRFIPQNIKYPYF